MSWDEKEVDDILYSPLKKQKTINSKVLNDAMVNKVNDLIEKQKSESKCEPTDNEKLNAVFGKSIAKIMKVSQDLNLMAQRVEKKKQFRLAGLQ